MGLEENTWEPILVAQDARRPGRRWGAVGLAVGLVAVVLAAGLYVTLPAHPAASVVPAVTATISVNASAVVAELPAGFLGSNVGSRVALGASDAAVLGATPITALRWPGGSTADEMNYTSGLITDDEGQTTVAAENVSAFVGFCRSLACEAILQLPGEIDDPATAAYYVAYTERTLGFTPAYWEIGDEPSLWTHFGIPWSAWNPTQSTNATPASYAALVHAYIAAIRTVDPAARVVGLPGVGTGVFGETTWLTATVRENGPNLSAVGIHVYPAGNPPPGPATLTDFYSNLSGPRSIAARVPADRAAIAAACPACGPIPLLVTEFGSGIEGGSFDAFVDGFPQVPFLASELIQMMTLNVSAAVVYEFESTRGGAFLDPGGPTFPLYGLYQGLLDRLPSEVIASSVRSSATGLFVLAARDGAGTETALLLDNANATTPIAVNLTGSGFPAGAPGSAWSYAAGDAAPVPAGTGDLNARWTVAPQSLLLIVAAPFGNVPGIAGTPSGAGAISGASAPVPLAARPAEE